MTPHCREKTMGPATICGGRAHQLTQTKSSGHGAGHAHFHEKGAHVGTGVARLRNSATSLTPRCPGYGTQSLFSAAASARSTDA